MYRHHLSDEEEKLYHVFQKIQNYFVPNLRHISPLDIPALLAETDKHPDQSHEWFRHYRYTLNSLINAGIVSDDTEKEKIIDYVQNQLTQHKEFVIRMMMMSAAIASPESPKRSLYNTIPGCLERKCERL